MLSLTKDMGARDKRDGELSWESFFSGEFRLHYDAMDDKARKGVKKLAAHPRLPQIMTFLRASVRTWVRHLPQFGALWLKYAGCWCSRLLDRCSPAKGLQFALLLARIRRTFRRGLLVRDVDGEAEAGKESIGPGEVYRLQIEEGCSVQSQFINVRCS